MSSSHWVCTGLAETFCIRVGVLYETLVKDRKLSHVIARRGSTQFCPLQRVLHGGGNERNRLIIYSMLSELFLGRIGSTSTGNRGARDTRHGR